MQLDHIAINVKNIKKAVKWYVSNLGATIKYQDDTWASLNVGGTTLALTIAKQHPPHFAFTLEKFSDFPEGHEIKYHRDGIGYIYKKDPSGNHIEILDQSS